MATGLKSRIVFKTPTSSANSEKGKYQLLGRAKSIPSPFGDPNMVDTSTLEDLVVTQEFGRQSAGNMTVPMAFDKATATRLSALENQMLDFCILYGTDGKGSEGIVYFQGMLRFTPDEATEDHLVGNCTIAVTTVPRFIEATVTVDELKDPIEVTLA